MVSKKVFILLISFMFTFMCAAIFFAYKAIFPKTEYIVFVDDDVFALYEGIFKDSPKEFSFLPQSEPLSKKILAPQKVVAAHLTLEKDLPILENAFTSFGEGGGSKNQAINTYYIIEENDILPSISADFSQKYGKNDAKLSIEPLLSLSFSTKAGKGRRALPVENNYAGSKDYALRAKLYIRTSIFDTPVKDAVKNFCDKTFSSIKTSASSPTVFIASVGDIMVSRGAQEVLINQKDGLKKVFGTTLPFLQKSDFTIGNLEGVVTASWNNAIKTYTFKFDKRVLSPLKEAGFDYLMQTNNHCYDYGEEGFKDTLRAFAEYNIPSSGIGYNEEEARAFYYTNIQGLPVAVISCGAYPVERSGFNGKVTATATKTRAGILWESKELLSAITAEKEKGYFVIVNVHGGEEYVFTPTKSQRALYESFCDAGASIVFGSHPHVLQDTEWYKESLIVYSQGNFIFNGMEEMPGATESEVVRVGIFNKRIAYVEQFPAKLDGFTVSLKN